MAIHSPNTGIVDFGKVAKSFGKDFRAMGGTIVTGFQVNILYIYTLSFGIHSPA